MKIGPVKPMAEASAKVTCGITENQISEPATWTTPRQACSAGRRDR